MKYSFLVLAFLISITITAQITINSSDLPQPGVEYYRSTENTPSIDVSQTGANQIWDFTALQGSSRDTLIYNTISQTPFLYQFMFNNPLDPTYKATEARYSPDVNLGGVLNMTNNYLFSKNSTTEWVEVGIGTTISSLPIPTKYTNTKVKIKLPLTYLSSNSDDYSYLMTIPAFGAQGQEGSLSYVVDGWGTIKTPGGSYSALRVKTEVVKSDTIYIQQLNFGLKIPTDETVYEWYAPGEGFPILTVTEQRGIVTSAVFLDDPVVGISENEVSTANLLYPNPAQNSIHLTLNSPDYKVSIIDLSGKLIREMDVLSPSQINVSTLPKGMYFIKLDHNENQEILRFIKQ